MMVFVIDGREVGTPGICVHDGAELFQVFVYCWRDIGVFKEEKSSDQDHRHLTINWDGRGCGGWELSWEW